MIRFIKGIFHPGINGSVIIETASGLGFEMDIPSNSTLYKTMEGEEVKVYTSMIVREDSMNLYGFADKESLEMFELLITVNGVGAKAAMSMMSILPLGQLKCAIGTGDVKGISAANGIGKKTAERVILELKDKVGTFEDTGGITADDIGGFAGADDERSQAVAGLVALGYTKNEAAGAVGKIKDEGLTCEEYIRKALVNLF